MIAKTAQEAFQQLAADKTESPVAREAAKRLNELLDLLRWFHDNGLALQIKPKKNGWTITIKEGS